MLRICFTWTAVDADFVGSWTLVAVTMTVASVAGAVNAPVGVIVPPDAVHVTAEE